MEDEGSPPSASAKRKAKAPSKKKTKRKREPKMLQVDSEVQTDDDPAFLKGPVVDFFLASEQAEAQAQANATPAGKPSRSRARTRTRPRSDMALEYDSQDNCIVDGATSDSDSDSVQGGHSDPNMSGISPPLPSNLVEPNLLGFETGFHVVTAGTEVGISVYKGIADSRLDCNRSSMHTFETWEKAQAYYRICFEAGCVHICEPLVAQTPILSPARKKTKFQPSISRIPGAKAPRQPNFAPATKMNKPDNPSASSTRDAQGSNCDLIATAINRHSHHGIQATTFQATTLSPQPKPHSHGQATPTPSPQVSRRLVVTVDSSDDESDTTPVAVDPQSARNPKNDNVVRSPIPSSSIIMEFSSPPANPREDSPFIIVSDDEDNKLTFLEPLTNEELRMLMAIQSPARPLPHGSRRV